MAGETDTRTFQERKHDRANALREKAKENAAARLGYDSVYSTGQAQDLPADLPSMPTALRSLRFTGAAGIWG